MLTSAKLTEGYLVVGITRELDKELSLHCSSIYINTRWSMLQQYLPALMSMPLPYYSSTIRLPYHIHMPWRHTLNLHCTCVHHVYTMRNHCPLTSSLTLTPSRLFPILLDPKSFQTILASVTWLPDHVLFLHCRLIIILSIYVRLTLTLAKVCPHSYLITLLILPNLITESVYFTTINPNLVLAHNNSIRPLIFTSFKDTSTFVLTHAQISLSCFTS